MPRTRWPHPPPRWWHAPWRAQRWLAKHLGYRGLVLMLCGLVYLGVAYSIPGAADYRPELFHTHLPVALRVSLWLIPGLIAVVVAWRGSWQGFGFAALFLSPAERAASFGAALVLHPEYVNDELPWSPLPGTLIYTLIAVLMLILAGWPEPPDGDRVEDEVVSALDRLHGAVAQVEAERRRLGLLSPTDHDDEESGP